MAQPDDTLTLVAGGQRLTGWESVSVTRGIEIMPSSFEIGLQPGSAAKPPERPAGTTKAAPTPTPPATSGGAAATSDWFWLNMQAAADRAVRRHV